MAKKKRPVKKRTDVSLPDEPTRPSDSMLDYIWLIYGQKKIGKTALASMFEDPFFCMWEEGGKALSLFQRPMPDWRTFIKYITLLRETDKFRTVINDTADMMYDRCMDFVCTKRAIVHPGLEDDFGASWSAVKKEFRRRINDVALAGKGIVFTSHSVQREIKKRGGGKYDRIVPTMSGQCEDVVDSLVDVWAYFDYDGDERFLQIEGDELVAAGHRLEGRFLYTDGTPIKRIPMGKSRQEAYTNLVAAFNNELEKEVEPKRRKRKTNLPKRRSK